MNKLLPLFIGCILIQSPAYSMDRGTNESRKLDYSHLPESYIQLHYAAINGDVPYVKYLIAHGADVNVVNRDWMTPLLYAAARNRPKVVRILLEAGADPRETDYRGMTPLAWAEYRKFISVIAVIKNHVAKK